MCPPSAMAPLVMVGASEDTDPRALLRHDPAIKRLARVEDDPLESEVPKGSAQIVVGEATACLPLGDLIDLMRKRRAQKALAKVRSGHREAGAQANSPTKKFVANAKPEIVVEGRARKAGVREIT
jgi:valyl-tRNA synthetase